MVSRLWILVLLLACMVAAATAEIPRTLSYQGVLRNADGSVVADGNYQLTFRLYEVSSGGTALWSETQTLAVRAGVLNAILGSVTALNLSFDRTYWLGITVSGGSEMSPRVVLTSAPYARRAARADSASLALPTHITVSSSATQLWITNQGTGTTARFENTGATAAPAVYCQSGGTEGALQALSTNGNGVHLATSGFAGIFEGTIQTAGFQLLPGASAGRVLTSDASGVGTWQLPASVPDNDWTVAGNDMYSNVTGRVGIGLLSPTRKLHVSESSNALAFSLKLDNQDPTIGQAGTGILFSSGGSGPDRGKGALVYRSEDTWNRGSFHFLQDPSVSTNNPTIANAVMTITNAGNVGIGTTSPQKKLEVAGDVQVGGNVAWTAKSGHLAVPAGAFHPESGGDWDNQGFAINAGPTYVSHYTAALQLPHGCTVTRVTLYWYDADPDRDVNIVIFRSSLNGNRAVVCGVESSGSGGVGNTVDTAIGYPVIDNSQYAYYVDAGVYSMTPGGLRLYGIVIDYTFTTSY